MIVVPSQDSNWCVAEGDGHEWVGGLSHVYDGNRRTHIFHAMEYAKRDGEWVGHIYEVSTDEELWQLSYSLYGGYDEESDVEGYVARSVSPLSDSEFLDRLAEYESGMLDGVAMLADGEDCMCETVWEGTVDAVSDSGARRYMEAKAREVLGK